MLRRTTPLHIVVLPAVAAFASVALLPNTARAAADGASTATPATAPAPAAGMGTASSDAMPLPDTATACRRIASERLKAGNCDAALSLLKHGLEIDPHDPDTYASLAEAQAARGMKAEALRSWRLAVGEEDNQVWSSSRMLDGDLQFRFALWLANEGQYDEAARMYEAGRDSLSPTDHRLMPEKWSGRDLKRNAATRQKFIAALETGLGMRCMDTGRQDAALAAFQQALAASPGDPVAELRLGRALYTAGRKEDAVAAWKRVLSASDRGELRASAEEALAHVR